MSDESKVRLDLSMPKRVMDRMENLKRMVGAESTAEVIRRALAVYEHAAVAQKVAGAKVLLVYPDSTTEEILIDPEEAGWLIH